MNTANKYRIITAKENPDLVNRASDNIEREWPEFMLHDPAADFLSACYNELPQYQFVLVDTANNIPLAIGNSIPLRWTGALEELPDDGWDWAITKGINDARKGLKPNILCALQIVVFGDNRGKGLSRLMIEAMSDIGAAAGLQGLIAPVRPSQKCDYPLIPIEDYITWTDTNGRPFDSWLRTHTRLGATVIKPCVSAMRITGSIEDWEKWTKMSFPQSGQYTIPGALVPIKIDTEQNTGVYVEPNVWMHHPPG